MIEVFFSKTPYLSSKLVISKTISESVQIDEQFIIILFMKLRPRPTIVTKVPPARAPNVGAMLDTSAANNKINNVT